ncbi:hypothetical protein FJZ36_02585 [Candidatus Poribacteria bacterium]|nr:hypothetical protein [Candidatus Poribacteria bacterium]
MHDRFSARVATGCLALMMGVALSASAAVANLAKNGDFEAGNTDPFVTYGDAQLKLDTTQKHTGKASAMVTVAKKGANFWDSGFQYNPGIEFKANTQYTFAAWVKSEGPKNINFKPELSADPWTAYGEKMMATTTTWKEYYVEFKPAALVKPASLTLHIAENDLDFWIDDVRWFEGTYVPMDLPTAVEPEGKSTTTWAAIKAR